MTCSSPSISISVPQSTAISGPATPGPAHGTVAGADSVPRVVGGDADCAAETASDSLGGIRHGSLLVLCFVEYTSGLGRAAGCRVAACAGTTSRRSAPPHNLRPTWRGSETESDQATRKTAPHRGAGHGFVPDERHSDVSRPAQGPCRAPSGSALRSAAPATKQAAGVPSAWSQPSPPPTRDHADGATLGRRDANASRRPRRPVTRSASGAASGTATGFSGRSQRQGQDSATVTGDQRPMCPPKPDVHGHLRVVQRGSE